MSGLVVFVVFAASTNGQTALQIMPPRLPLPGGCLPLAAGAILVGAAISVESLALLIVGAVVSGFGQGLSFRAGLAVTAACPADRRGEVTSIFERAAVAVQPRQQLHVGRKVDEERSRPRHDRHERVHLALNAADRDDPHLAPVDLQLLTGFDVETRFGECYRARAVSAYVLLDDGATAIVAALLQF
ncbi:MAG: hypothetical protein ACREM8_04065, partial [Vulcanimicrobiaceae bacterium]